ncbi:hypothetical protein [Marinibacterium sp. SX1]
MTNSLALFLAVVISVAIVLDLAVFGTDHTIFLGKKLYDLIEWMAFWR